MFKLREKTQVLSIFLILLFVFERVLKNFYFSSHKVFYNQYLAFNLYLGQGIFYLFFFLIFSLLIFFLILSFKKGKTLPFFSFGLIIIGALSNFLDRLFYQAVIDYWQIPLTIFNLADIYILIGVILLFFLALWKKEKF